ncbi:NAD(P)H-hydrate dehydratase [Piscinibacter sp.]|jgi:hydroxyethylthiazole kinase-like uncharacterized protein yjeF|uniref:NAD(P)H-hydrate dehydratase n=1 Tax=Piscinibacter sp. TaxID=1903157 RepID=UPI002F3F7110
MRRILPPTQTLPLFGVERTRAIEQRASAGLPPHALMRRAGAAVARLALALAPHAQRVWIAAGPGNNGGDGLEAATHLLAAGKAVQVTLCADAQRMPDDARDAMVRAQAAGVSIGSALPALQTGDMAIDALLGIGASRPPSDALAALIGSLNALPCPVLAVDTPSGLNTDTGQALGDVCVRADHTLALLALKPGLFTAAGRDHAGSVWFDALDVDSADEPPDAWLVGADILTASPRAHAQHKGSFGDVAVVGGAAGMTGAALLAARAAHAAGTGRVYLSLLDPAAPSHDPLRPELMLRRVWWKAAEETLAHTTVVCGCGGSDAVREPLPRLLATADRLVLDADALNLIATDTQLQALLRSRAARQRFSVLTPHPLEAARLLDSSAAQVQADRLAAARALADRFDCVVVLKGSGSVIAAPGEVARINPTGNAALATAGTGDVLAGWLGGLWAQDASNTTQHGTLQLACRATFMHGAAADAAATPVLRAGDLVERLHASLSAPPGGLDRGLAR